MLGFEKGQRPRAIIGRVNFRLAGKAREDFLINLKDVLLIVEDENLLACYHKGEWPGAWRRAASLRETPRWRE